MNWLKKLRGRVAFGESLKLHTSFRIGGPAEFFVEPYDADDLRLVLSAARISGMPVRVIGAGSNLLIRDAGVPGVVIKLSYPFFRQVWFWKHWTISGAGCPLPFLLKAASGRGYGGVEYLAGMPGSLGGAVAMNAGGARHCFSIGDFVESMAVMDYSGAVRRFKNKDIRFAYRQAAFPEGVILNVRLKLFKQAKRQAGEKIENFIRHRYARQDFSLPSAGCVFRNPRRDSAGRLIDRCRFKGAKIGGAVVSDKHANFILNTGQATARDVFELIDKITGAVKNKFNITLKPEIKIW